MRVIAVLLVAVLAGCAHTPWGYNFTKNGEIPNGYRADKSQCHDQSWSDAKKEVGTSLSDVFLHLFDKGIVKCMAEKGYERVASSRIHYVSSLEAVQVGAE